ncbi:MAG: hypothetical protein PHW83_11990 [Bacteroidales bacterium]|jgi:molybdopterin converting factor small subunit|nr:hypothetical protein [Bacteroidales bacterium]
MKKIINILAIGIIVFAVFSCNNKKNEQKVKTKPAETLEELNEKYSKKEFKDCDEFLAAGDEIIDVYIKRVNEAYDGDEKAKADVEEFEKLMLEFDKQADKFSSECPEKFDKWAEKTDKRVAEITEKLIVIFYDEYEGLEWNDEELEKELQKQLDELNEDLKKVQEEGTEL